MGRIPADHALLAKLFDASGTVLDHKTGPLGVPLNILVGWYSKPEVIQFVLQHLYVAGAFVLWGRIRKTRAAA